MERVRIIVELEIEDSLDDTTLMECLVEGIGDSLVMDGVREQARFIEAYFIEDET